MNKTVLILLFSIAQAGYLHAQGKYIARQGQVTFFSYTSVENIEASNNQVFSIVDIEKEALAVSMFPNVASGSSIAWDGDGFTSNDWTEDSTPTLGSGNAGSGSSANNDSGGTYSGSGY